VNVLLEARLTPVGNVFTADVFPALQAVAGHQF